MNIVFQRLWPELAKFKKKLIVVLLLGIAVSGLKSSIPEFTNQLVEAWNANNKARAYQIPWFIFAFWLFSGVARYFHLFWMKYISDLIAVKLRRDLMNKYLSLNVGFIQDFQRGSGALISRMLNDIIVIQEGIHKLADLMREPFMAMFMIGYLIYIDWKLTIFLVVMAPIISLILRKFAKSLRKYGHKSQEAMEDLSKTLKESLDGTRIVQSFQLEEEMRKRFNFQADNYLATRKNIIRREEAAGPISESITAFALAFLLSYISHQVFDNAFTIGAFTSFMFALGLLLDSLRKIQNGYIKLQQASVALERLQDILEHKNLVSEIDAPKDFPQNWDQIQFKNIHLSFEDKKVLDGIDLSIKKGEQIAIVGASGSGKSTLMNTLQRFFDPDQGEILIGDVSIKDLSLDGLRKNIALVTQDVFLFSDTIEKNIQMGDLSKPITDVQNAAKLANAHDFISEFPDSYKSQVGDRGARISGGEKQRISIARAIFKDAPILILDEATSALDSASELEVQKGLQHLIEGRTSFVIAHRLSTITQADRIIVFKDGKIVESGTHTDLLNQKGEYSKYHQLQTQ